MQASYEQSSAGVERDLLVAAMRLGRRLRAETARHHNPAAVWLLHQLQAKAPLRVSDLAVCMGLDVSTVSRQVRQLEDAGYLDRTEDPEDRRASHVELTSSGCALLHEAMDARAAVLAEALRDWSAEDRRTLTTLIIRLVEDIDRPTLETENR